MGNLKAIRRIRAWWTSLSNTKQLFVYVAVFTTFGFATMLLIKASPFQAGSEAENGTLTGNIQRDVGVPGVSGGQTVTFGPPTGNSTTAPQGVLISWGSNTLANNSYVQGGQIVFNWPEIEPSRGTFCWDNPRGTQGGRQVGCGTNIDNSSHGLAAQLAYFKSISKNATVQVNSTVKPQWIYAANSGVELCGHQAQLIYSQAPYDIPMYWKADGTLNDAYFNMMQEMLSSLATTIRNQPNKVLVSGVRASPNLVGTEFVIADPTTPHVGGRITLTTPNCSAQSVWSMALANQAYARVMQMNYNTLEPDIRPILRQQGFTSLGQYNLDDDIYLAATPGKIQPWFFVTSGDGDLNLETKNSFANKWAKSGNGIGYEELILESPNPNLNGQSPTSWLYWTHLMLLDKGISYIATFGQDITLAQTNSEYRATLDFTNKYAKYNDSNIASSPGAWIALAPKNGEAAYTPTKGNFTKFMTEDTSDGSVALNSLGTPADGTCWFISPPCAGVNPIGNSNQRFGRWARKTNLSGGKPSILISMDSTFKNSLSGTAKAYVTYLDNGFGSWTLDWGGGSQTINKSNTGNWITTSAISVPVNQISKNVSNNDFGLTAHGNDTTFHMLEINR